MAQRREANLRQNLLIKSDFYSQNLDLSFKNASLNSRFSIELSRLKLAMRITACFSLLSGAYCFMPTLLLFGLVTGYLALFEVKVQTLALVGSVGLILPQLRLAEDPSCIYLIFLPTTVLHYLSSKHWKLMALAGSGQLLLLLIFTEASFFPLVLSLFIYVAIFILLEREARDLWLIADSYKKSNTLHLNLFNSLADGVLITDLDGNIQYYNSAIFKYLPVSPPLLVKNVKALLSGHIEIASILKNCARGNCHKSIVILKQLSREPATPHELWAYELTVKPTSWISGNSIKFSLHDVTVKWKQHAFMLNNLKDMQNSYNILSRELERTFNYQELVRREDLGRLYMLNYSLTNMIAWKMAALGSIEFKQRHFDIRREVVQTLEGAVLKCLERAEELLLIFDASFPAGVQGDPDIHNQLLKIALIYALQTAVQDSTIKIYCDVVVGTNSGNDYKMKYKIVYSAPFVSEHEINYLLGKDNQDFDKLVEMANLCGLGIALFPLLIEAMEGQVTDFFKQQSEDKYVFAYCFPMKNSQKRLVTPLLNSSEFFQRINNNMIKWRRNFGTFSETAKAFEDTPRPSIKSSASFSDLFRIKSDRPELTPEQLRMDPAILRKLESSMESVNEDIEESLSARNDTEVSFSMESVDEDVQVGKIYQTTQSLPLNDSRRSSTSDQPSDRSNLKKKSNSSKNPFTFSEKPSLEVPSTLKKFLAPKSIDLRLVREQGPPKALLVEDNDFDRQLVMKCIMEVCNWEADIAMDGEEAISRYKDYASQGYMYAFICMDISLPRIDGYDTVTKIREIERLEKFERTKILGLYKEYDRNAKTRCLQSGMDDAVLKTYDQVKTRLSELV